VDEGVLKYLRSELKTIFKDISDNIRIINEIWIIPEEYYDFEQELYLSTLLLLEIRNFAEKMDLDIVLGIAEVGLDVRFGQAEFGPEARAAIISLYRLYPGYYAQAENKNLFLSRVLKEGLHEIGHILGGDHCINNCIMKFSQTVTDIDMKPIAFCEECRETILKSS